MQTQSDQQKKVVIYNEDCLKEHLDANENIYIHECISAIRLQIYQQLAQIRFFQEQLSAVINSVHSFSLAFVIQIHLICTSLLNAVLKTRTHFYRVGITRLLLQSPLEYKEMLLNGILMVMSNLYKSLKICCYELLCNIMNNSFKMVLDNETKFLLGLKWKHSTVNKIQQKNGGFNFVPLYKSFKIHFLFVYLQIGCQSCSSY